MTAPEIRSGALDRHPHGDAARRILAAALDAVDPARRTAEVFATTETGIEIAGHALPLQGGRVWIAGAGKAAVAMTTALVEALGDRVAGGVIVTKHAEVTAVGPVQVLTAGHPTPDARSEAAGAALLEIASRAQAQDIVLCPVSGGASSLAVAPTQGTTVEAIAVQTAQMLAGGATVAELNRARSRVDRLKGGGLARAAAPARVVGFVLRDVAGGDASLVGSGPTYAENALNVVIADNATAVEAAAAAARSEGFVVADHVALRGEASAAGIDFARTLTELADRGAKVALIGGGETVVHVRGTGLGGRNLELALAAAPLFYGLMQGLLVTLGTDGEDGPTNAAGAVVDGGTLVRALEAGLDPAQSLLRNDSYRFFDGIDALIHTGPTGTNVCDLALGLVG